MVNVQLWPDTVSVNGLILAGHTYLRIYMPVIPTNPLAVSLNAHLCGWSEPLDCRRHIDICSVCSRLPRSTQKFPRQFFSYGHACAHTCRQPLLKHPDNTGLYVNCVTFVDTHSKVTLKSCEGKPKRLRYNYYYLLQLNCDLAKCASQV